MLQFQSGKEYKIEDGWCLCHKNISGHKINNQKYSTSPIYHFECGFLKWWQKKLWISLSLVSWCKVYFKVIDWPRYIPHEVNTWRHVLAIRSLFHIWIPLYVRGLRRPVMDLLSVASRKYLAILTMMLDWVCFCYDFKKKSSMTRLISHNQISLSCNESH